MARYTIEPADYQVIAPLARTMREADRREIWAAGRLTPEQALLQSAMVTPQMMACFVDGEPVAALGIGVVTALSDKGIPWLLSSTKLVPHARRFLRLSDDYMSDARQHFRRLENYVDARNVQAVKWLDWLGFDLKPAEPFGPDHLPFHRFVWERDNV